MTLTTHALKRGIYTLIGICNKNIDFLVFTSILSVGFMVIKYLWFSQGTINPPPHGT